VSYKCAFVLLHKLREAMAVELKGRTIRGDGKIAEVDGGNLGCVAYNVIKLIIWYVVEIELPKNLGIKEHCVERLYVFGAVAY
jgi:hypothetical protein